MPEFNPALASLLLVWLGLCAGLDYRSRRLPNLLILLGASLAIGSFVLTGASLMGGSTQQMLWGVLAILGILLPGFLRGVLGAGDVKLLAVVALSSHLVFSLYTLILAGFLMFCWVCVFRFLPQTWPWGYLRLEAKASLKSKLAYAPFVFLAAGFQICMLRLWG
ncbi:prepilin peptidase [Nitrincola tapanii]|uniref:Prepilin peptidase n=1 Tax=Nitrincola tapanii TaxID=1708751 RepID=A0A5A9W0R6_9GAMM|nr:prepilin peptidase [Nitrincola tapanii]KAA0874084.1 prepilin peptidase [Nitrincola tapanii]